jgi:ribosomal protein L35
VFYKREHANVIHKIKNKIKRAKRILQNKKIVAVSRAKLNKKKWKENYQ